jgi:error-prone DNA polymerase
MGFYSPRALVADAQRHGVEVRPVSAVRSDWDCTLEPSGDGVALRLGLRLVVGLAEEDGRRLVAARAEQAFTGLAALAARCGLDRGALRRLADADAFADLGVPRRAAAWVLQGLWTGLPLFDGAYRESVGADEVAKVPELPAEGPMDTLRADYRATGLSVDLHPVGLMRAELSRRGICRAIDVLQLEDGAGVEVVGLVTVRQRPGTANGVVFMTLEDETGMVNLVLWARVWADNRRVGRSAAILGARGRLQKDGGAPGTGGAASVVVERLFLPDEATEVPSTSRDFH